MHSFQPLVFSGVQATGNLHLGNYLGALKHWVSLQKQFPCIFCVVDMHALTTNKDPNLLRSSTYEVTAAFLAAGIDPEKHIIFNQSRVYQHAELAWIFNCVARLGWMSRMTQFKDKAGKNSENASLGLFSYPTLMAADILLYRATLVPVGDDQKQHIELTRDIAQKFNNDYAEAILASSAPKVTSEKNSIPEFFPLVEALLAPCATRVMSLRDGTKKMSKSDPSELSRINLSDSPEDIAKKIRKAKTDAEVLPDNLSDLSKRPEADNLITIYAALSDQDKEKTLLQFAGKQFSDFKPILIDCAIEKLAPITKKLQMLQKERDYVHKVLKKGAEKAQEKAEQTMKYVRDIVGFV